MSNVDHAAAIRALTGQRYIGYHLAERINHHADALAAERDHWRMSAENGHRRLAEAEARAARLREAYLDAEEDSVKYALPAHNDEHDDNVTGREWIKVLRDAHLQPGDLDDMEERT